MNVIELMKLEIDGILTLIEDYTGDPIVNNWTSKLRKAITENDLKLIHYFIKEIQVWYNAEFSEMMTNDFCYHKHAYRNAKEKLNMYVEELENYDADEVFVERNKKSNDIAFDKQKVFIVHGRNEAAKLKVESFIKSLGLIPVVLHRESNQGQTVIEKLESNSNVGYAIILYTACDLGGLNDSNNVMKPRARQNVVFEHGYFTAKLGRNRVCPLVEGDVEIPNDLSGIVYVPLDEYDGWHNKIIKELQGAGYILDYSKIFG